MTIKTILFALPSPKEDTPERMSFVKLLAEGIQARGITVHMFRVIRSGNPMTFVRQGIALRRTTRDTNPDLTVAQFGTYTGLLVALFARRPVIITYRGSDLNPEPYTNILVRTAQHAASHLASFFADGIVCVSRELAARLIVQRPTAIIPSPTDMASFQPLDREKSRSILGWDLKAPIAVFFSGNNPKLKGIDLAYVVKGELARRHSSVNLQIIPQVPILNMPTYLSAADCLLFLSRFEGSPNLIRDACACNLPIVSTPAGDIPQVLEHVDPKRIVSRNVEEVADALEQVCLMQTSSNGREHMEQYATPVIASRSVEFYQQVLTAGSRSALQTVP